jgi:LysM repeat protein
MVCKTKINSLQYLRNKDLINDVNRILNETAFDAINEELTRYAEVKYNLPTEGKMLYSKYKTEQTDDTRSRYVKDAKYAMSFAEPNDVLFNTLDELIKLDESRNTTDLIDSLGIDYKSDSEVNKEYDKRVKNAMIDFMKGLNITVNEDVEEIVSKQKRTYKNAEGKTITKEDPMAAFDLLQKYLAIKENISNKQLAKQTAYVIHTFLGKKSKLGIELWKSVDNWSKYDYYYNKYSQPYEQTNEDEVTLVNNDYGDIDMASDYIKKVYEFDPERFNPYAHKQVIIEFLSEMIIAGADNIQSGAKISNPDINKAYFESIGYKDKYAQNWLVKMWNRVWNWIQEHILNNKAITIYSEQKLNEVVLDIVDDVYKKDYTKFIRDYVQNAENGKFFTKQGVEFEEKDYQKSLDNDWFAKDIITKLFTSAFDYILSGSLVLRKYGRVIRAMSEDLHDIDGVITLEQFESEENHEKFLKWIEEVGLPLSKDRSTKNAAKFKQQIVPLLEEQSWYKDVKKLFPSWTLENTFIGTDHKKGESITISGYIEHPTEMEEAEEEILSYGGRLETKMVKRPKRYILDFFLRTQEGNYPEIFDHYYKDWKQIFEAKINMGRSKDLNDLIYFEPYRIDKYKYTNKGFRYFTFADSKKGATPLVLSSIEESGMSKELDPFTQVETIELSVPQMEKARAKEILDIITEKLSANLGVSYANVTAAEATEILKDRPVPYNGELGFFHGGTVYTVGDNVSLSSALHEFGHPLLGAIRRENKVLFNNLYEALTLTDEGQALENFVQKRYPELLKGGEFFKEEVLNHALQLKSLNKINEQIASKGFDAFITKLLKAIKDLLKNIFGTKAVIAKLNVDTSLETLADMLLTKSFEYDTFMATEEDVVMYLRSINETAENLAENVSVKALQDGINRVYALADGVIKRAKNFKKNTPEYTMLQESIFMDINKNKLFPAVKSSLAPFQNFSQSQSQTRDDIIDNALDAESRRLKDITTRTISFVNSLDVMNESAKYMFDNILAIQNNVGFVSRPSIALLSMYKVDTHTMGETITKLDEIFRKDFNLGPGNSLYTLISEITQNLIRNEELIRDIKHNATGQFYVELTGAMNEFLAEELNTNLKLGLEKKMTEPEIEILYNKVIQQNLTDEDIEALSKIKGVNMRYINKFIEKYNYFVQNEEKIFEILSGNTKDVSVISRYLESYSTSNDPIIGSLAIWINDKKVEAQNTAIKQAHGLRVKLEKLLPKVNFNPNKTNQIYEMIASEDEVFDIDKKTGKPIRRKVGAFLSDFGNGYRYDKSELEFNIAEAFEKGDEAEIKKAEEALANHMSDYMWDKYLPEVYEKDKIFNEHPMGRQAWLDRKLIIEEMQNAISPVANELERFEKYSAMQALWKEYNQLYSFTYADGLPKVDSPEDGVFDLTKAKILKKHREATRDYNEFVPIEGSVQTAYNNFVLLIQGQDIERDSDEFTEKLDEWEKQNIRKAYSPKYYEAVSKNIKRLIELQSKIKEAMSDTFDIGSAYSDIYDLMLAFKDEQGQPIPQELGVERLKKIKDINQNIVNFKAKFDQNTGLTKVQTKELDFIKEAMRKNVSLTDEQKLKYAKLSGLQQVYGLSVSEIEEINDIYAELGDLRSTVPTEYYMDIINAQLSEINVPEVADDKVDEFINSTEFALILANNEKFAEWFYNNHITRQVYKPDISKYVNKFERSSAYSLKIPNNPDYYLKTEITDKETGEKIIFDGSPNARHCIYKIKDKYRTIPFEDDYSKYIGIYVNNKGEYLPRPYKPGEKYSAVSDKYVNKKFFELNAKKGPELELLNAVKEYFLEIQKGKAGNSKLYLDIPRYALKDNLEIIQSGLLQGRYEDFKGSLKHYWDSAWGKASDEFENGYNYNSDNNLVNTDLNGDEVGYVPVTGLYRLDINQTTKDVFTSLFQHAMSLEIQSKLIETLPLVESILETVEDPANAPKKLKGWSKQVFKLTGEKRRSNTRDKKSQRAGQLRSLIEREYYGRKVVGVEENNIILSKILNGLQGLSARSSLALNPSSDLKNRYGAIAQNIVEASGGEFVDLKSLAMGRIWAAKAMLDWSAKGIYAKGTQSLTTQLIMAFDPAFKTEKEYGRSVSRSMSKDLLNGSFLYDFRKFGEMEGQLQLFGGFMDKKLIELNLTNGNVAKIKYAEAWELDADGYIKLKNGIDPEWSNQPIYHDYIQGETIETIAKKYYTTPEAIKKKNKLDDTSEITPGTELIIATSDKFKKFRNQHAGTSHLLYGAYDAFAQPEGDQYLAYRMFFFMRKWATPMFINKWGADIDTSEGIGKMKVREKYNWELSKTRMGYYTKTLQTITELVKSKGAKYNYMTPDEKVAMKKTLADTVQMIVYALIVGMLFGYDSDDDDRWEKLKAKSGPFGTPEFKPYGFLAQHSMLLLLGVQAETSAFLPLPKIGGVQFGLDDYTKFLTQTTSAFGNTITLYAKILQDIFNTVSGDEDARYQRKAGPYWWQDKETLKIWGHTFKTIGFTGGTGDPVTLTKNLENSGVKIG